jgi:hypothetical protein
MQFKKECTCFCTDFSNAHIQVSDASCVTLLMVVYERYGFGNWFFAERLFGVRLVF